MGTSTDYTHAVANEIRRQLHFGVLMALGASNLRHGMKDQNPALFMNVRVLPYNASGKRLGTPRIMLLTIELTPWDDYTITVSYTKNQRGVMTEVIHEQHEHVTVDVLNSTMLSIDSMRDRAA